MERLIKQKEIALSLIKEKYGSVVDKGGHPYLNHLLFVSDKIKEIREDLSKYTESDDVIIEFYKKGEIVALLHDILEDTDTTVNELKSYGFDDDIIEAVINITREKNENSYFLYIEKVRKNDLSKLVKIYDLENNMDIKRLKKLTKTDFKRLNKYWNCWRYLRGEITSYECQGNIINFKLK